MYEKHVVKDKLTPYTFHRDIMVNDCNLASNWHENIEILYFTEGSADVICNMNSTHVTKGDIFVVNKNYLHRVKSVDCVKYFCLIIDNKFCKENGIDCSRLRFANHIVDQEGKFLCDELIDTYDNYSKFKVAKMRLKILALVEFLAENYSEETIETEDVKQTEFVRKIIEYINENFAEEITIDYLSKHAGYSKAYLSRQFKIATGLTIIEYINYIRCINAHEMLTHDNSMTVSEVALECGFANMSYFSRTYKKVIGKLPSAELKSKI